MRHLAIGVVVAALAVIGVTASSASAAVYWTNAANGTVGRAGLDGSNVNQSFITGVEGIQNVAVDAEHIYWGDALGGVGRSNLDGSGVDHNFIPDVHADGVAVDSGHVYWSSLSTHSIGRANLDGSGVNPAIVTGLDFPVSVAVDADHLYWADEFADQIGRADLDGSNPDTAFMTGLNGPTGLDVDAGHLYFASPGDRFIYRAQLDGTNVQPFVGVVQSPQGVAVDGGHIYWSSLGLANEIGRMNLDGEPNVELHFVPGASGPLGVAVDGLSVEPPDAPVPPAPPASSTPAPASTAAAPPELSALSLTKRAFPVGRRGTRFSFRLDQAAMVRVRIQRKLSGGRLRKAGALSRAGRAGANRIRFTGRVSGRALRPGRYRAVFTAANDAGKSAARAVGFRILAR